MMDGNAWEHGEQVWPELAAQLKGCGIPFSVHPPAWDGVFAAMRGLPGDPLYVLEYATNTPLRELELGRDLLLREIGDK